jgi:hypothetical protein
MVLLPLEEGEGKREVEGISFTLTFVVSPAFVPQGGTSRRQAPGKMRITLLFGRV